MYCPFSSDGAIGLAAMERYHDIVTGSVRPSSVAISPMNEGSLRLFLLCALGHVPCGEELG